MCILNEKRPTGRTIVGDDLTELPQGKFRGMSILNEKLTAIMTIVILPIVSGR